MNKFVVFVLVAVCAFADALLDIPLKYNTDDGGYVFTPHELPCEYIIYFEQRAKIVESGAEIGKVVGAYFKHGSYFKVAAAGSNILQFGETEIEYVYRPDLKGPEGNVTVFYANQTLEDYCVDYNMTEKEMAESVANTLKLFLQNSTHDNKKDGQFMGVDCSIFYDGNETVEKVYELYVNKDNYLIGASYIMDFDLLNTSYTDHVELLTNLTYAFECPPTVFKNSRDVSDECRDVAYAPPTKNQCYVPPSSSQGNQSSSTTSMASTTKAAALTLLFVVLVALL